MKKEPKDWEKRFEELWWKLLDTYNSRKEKEIKQFISTLLQEERKKLKEEIKKWVVDNYPFEDDKILAKDIFHYLNH